MITPPRTQDSREIERFHLKVCDMLNYLTDRVDNRQTWYTISDAEIRRIILSFVDSPKPQAGIKFAFSEYYDSDYDGPVSGTVSGISAASEYRVDVYSVTDIGYLQGSSEINVDGTWSIVRARKGMKQAQLVRLADSLVVADIYTGSGIVRSYTNIPINDLAYQYLRYRCYTYDQAVALVALCTTNDQPSSEYLANGFITIYDKNGDQIPAWVHHQSGICDDPTYMRTGGLAWALYALAFFAQKFPASTLVPKINTMIDTIAALIISYIVPDAGYQQGAVRGGRGRYNLTTWVYDPNYIVQWCSTEHNLDAWFALTLAGTVRGNADYTAAADTIKTALLTNFWNKDLARFVQGISSQIKFDTADALDCHSWGGIWLQNVGETAMAIRSIWGCNAFTTSDKGVVGYRPYTPEGGYPNAGKGVWGEGTLGVSLARAAIGDVSGAITDFNGIARRVDADGLPYSTTRDYLYELSDWHSVCAISWLQIARNPAGFWGVW